MSAVDQLRVLESRGSAGIFLAMGWAASSAELARVLGAWAAGRGEVAVLSAAGHEAEMEALREKISGLQWPVAENVTESEQIAALRWCFFGDGWLLSREGAAVMAAAKKISSGARLVIDFQSPLGEAADLSRVLAVVLPLKLPAGAKVGGIITPQ
jgi:hypothetical protein